MSKQIEYVGGVPRSVYWVRLTPPHFYPLLRFARSRLWTESGEGSTCFTVRLSFCLHVVFWNDYEGTHA